jgi:GTP pyrophosphokinase
VSKRQHFNNVEEFFAAIGYGGIILSKIMPRIKDDYIKAVKPQNIQLPENVTPRHTSGGVIVEGLENCLVKISRCCNPLPGDRIVGFITRGFGVSVHKQDCPNVINNQNDPQYEGRWVRVHWAENSGRSFKAALRILSSDRYGLLADVTTVLAAMHIQIHTVVARELKNGTAEINLTVDIGNIDQLDNVISRIAKINGVHEVSRAGNKT